MPVKVKWAVWAASWAIFVWRFVPDLFVKRFARNLWFRIVLCSLPLFFYQVMRSQIRAEQASTTSGVIQAEGPVAYPSRVIEFGNSGVKYIWTDRDNELNYKDMGGFYDFGIRIESGPDGVELSTVVRDRSGRLLARIEKNRWSVPAGIEKNFTGDSLEVLDAGEHAAIQVRLLSDRVQLRGEWHNELGGGMQIDECPDTNSQNRMVGCVKFWKTFDEELQIKKTFIEPIFEYPASQHLGELKPTP